MVQCIWSNHKNYPKKDDSDDAHYGWCWQYVPAIDLLHVIYKKALTLTHTISISINKTIRDRLTDYDHDHQYMYTLP